MSKPSKKNPLVGYVMSALFAALIIVGAYIKIPVPPVPFTLQTLFVVLSGLVLGARFGTFSVLVYMLLGLAGLPVFAGGSGGIGSVLMPTFGYIIGFAVGAFVSGLIASNSSYPRLLGASFAAMGIIYFFGMLYYYLMKVFYLGDGIEIKNFIFSFFILTAPKDVVTCFVAAALAKRLRRFRA